MDDQMNRLLTCDVEEGDVLIQNLLLSLQAIYSAIVVQLVHVAQWLEHLTGVQGQLYEIWITYAVDNSYSTDLNLLLKL